MISLISFQSFPGVSTEGLGISHSFSAPSPGVNLLDFIKHMPETSRRIAFLVTPFPSLAFRGLNARTMDHVVNWGESRN